MSSADPKTHGYSLKSGALMSLCKYAFVVSMAVYNVGPVGAQTSPWVEGEWVRWNSEGIGNDTPNSPYWEGATFTSSSPAPGMYFTVYCAADTGGVGYDIGIPVPVNATAASEGVASIAINGVVFELPGNFENGSETFNSKIVGGSPLKWSGQNDFLMSLISGSFIQFRGLVVDGYSVPMPVMFATMEHCGAGIERVARLCGLRESYSWNFCSDVFCPTDNDILSHFRNMVDGAPDDLFASGKELVISNAEDASEAMGGEGVYAFAEGLCFSEEGLAYER